MQLELPFASLDFPGRTTLTVGEVAERLGCTQQHVLDLVEEGALAAIDIAGRGNLSARRAVRIPLEGYRDFVLRSLTTPVARDALWRSLPVAALRQMHRELGEFLANKSCAA